ncbi:hypothetical protein ONZ45_g7550 [Pleurotus djamor]|nr:hypothetical protein ONZ45_g7550 [Pleurotus djamor]
MKLVTRAWLSDFILGALQATSPPVTSPPSNIVQPLRERIQEVFKYVTLSHRWLKEEITITDLPKMSQVGSFEGKEESHEKIVGFFEAAREAGYRFVWFDSGCIDQHNGPEIEESIRAMFSWYRNAHVCFIHLQDTTRLTNIHDDGWFKRGWTLQELMAPERLQFFDKHWSRLSTTKSVYDLDRERNSRSSMKTKWGDEDLGKEVVWGSARSCLFRLSLVQHTPLECLDILRTEIPPASKTWPIASSPFLDIHMPIAYGEGDERAFYRLQLACMQDTESRAILNWKSEESSTEISFDIFDSPPADVSFTINNGRMYIMMCLFDLASSSIAESITAVEDSWSAGKFNWHLRILDVKDAEPRSDTHLSGYSSRSSRIPTLNDFTIGIYGWTGTVSHGVLLCKEKKGTAYRRATFAPNIVKLPSSYAILESGIQPQWVSIK